MGTRTNQAVRNLAALITVLSEQFARRVALIGTTNEQYAVVRTLAGWAATAGFDVEAFRDPVEAFTWPES